MQATDLADTGELSRKTFARFAEFITSELGIKMPDSKLTMVQNLLLRRVRELHLKSVEQYSEYFFTSANAEERDHFINAITTNKTDGSREGGWKTGVADDKERRLSTKAGAGGQRHASSKGISSKFVPVNTIT